ncbi:MAG TPA: aspartate--tRNA ligase [Verrucomicrobiae bacterium]|nr:aspartate--tRNA ligase [Verrucomicrobiae bacterium]
MLRTHHCAALRAENVGQTVTLCGWVHSRRDHGGVLFVDLRDREGVTQVVFNPQLATAAAEAARGLRAEFVIRVEGEVVRRSPETVNAKLPTGEIEVAVKALAILNRSEVPPFPLDEAISNEDLRLEYRYLDLRRAEMFRNLAVRHRVVKAVRDYFDSEGFLEVETPILAKSTPEGARDFLVPSRLNPGRFYALPQAPQQFKQLLMVAGLERYFQIAKCFRDEDLRADRQPEFTQVDVEVSFLERDDIIGWTEGVLRAMFKAGLGVEVPTPFPRMSYREAMDRFGSDKPDTRFGMELTDAGDIFRASGFKVFRETLDKGGVVKAINAKGFACVTTGQIERLTELAKRHGAKGLAFIKVEGGEWKSPIVKFFSEAEKKGLSERLGIEEGDLVLFGADKWSAVCEVLGRIRLEIAAMQKLTEGSRALNFLWVLDFPLLDFSVEENKWNAVHHPFTRPKAEDVPMLDKGEYGAVRAEAYDVVLNGVEIGGGSLRIHEPDLQAKMFGILGVGPEQQEAMFGHIIKALGFGAPPHGGIALGLDRAVMLICGAESIRDVMAFPKNNRGQDLMCDAPSAVDAKQLKEIYIRTVGGDAAS